MKKSITQESDYGCGVACFAFVCDLSYHQAITYLGREYSVKHGWRASDLVAALNNSGKHYKNNYVRKSLSTTFTNNTIILIERSRDYPVGHYLVFYKGSWMDPWINLPVSNDVKLAKSGFRDRLPGKAMYALIPNKVS